MKTIRKKKFPWQFAQQIGKRKKDIKHKKEKNKKKEGRRNYIKEKQNGKTKINEVGHMVNVNNVIFII